jgi:hypothetical protein
VLRIRYETLLKGVVPASETLAFTLVPHLQIINYRGRFWLFAGI